MSSKLAYGFSFFLSYIILTAAAGAQVHQPRFVPVAPEALSSAFIRCVYKDSKGFVWFGTEDGLVRYDGTNLVRYENIPGDNKSISNSRINVIIEDSRQRLWIGTAQGLGLYSREKDNFTEVDSIPQNKNHLNNRYITALQIDPEGKVWIGTFGNGVNVYDPRSHTFSYLFENEENIALPSGNYIASFFLRNDTIWTGTRGGLKLYNTKTVRPIPLKISDEVITKDITKVMGDDSGSIWFSTFDRQIAKLSFDKGGLSIKKKLLEKNKRDENGGSLLTMAMNKNGMICLGGENYGFALLDPNTFEVQFFPGGKADSKRLPTNSIQSIYVDRNGITWIGTQNNGVFLVDENLKKFDTYQLAENSTHGQSINDVKGIAQDKQGVIWAALLGGGLAKLVPGSSELKLDPDLNKLLETKYLSTLFFDSNDYLWVGTWGKGLYRVSLRTHEVKKYKIESNGFGDNMVYCIYEDSKKDIWVGSVGSGLFYLNKDNEKFVLVHDENKSFHLPRNAYVTSIKEDGKQNLWVGTLYGLYELEKFNNSFVYNWYPKSKETGGLGYEISTIYEDRKQNMWLGTADNGIAWFDVKNIIFKAIQKKDGLASNKVMGILPDAHENIWISTNMGLTKYISATHSFFNYNKQDGLPSNKFNLNAALAGRDGWFYFGTDNGLLSFHPDSIRRNSASPVVYLTDLKINNQSVRIAGNGSPLSKHISLTKEIELTFNQRSFVIDFVAPGYSESSRNDYCYKLEGFDEEWNCIGSNHSATYTNLDPGSYLFYAKAVNTDGVWSRHPATLKITILPAPWKTWYAILFYMLVVAALLLLLVKIRTERIKIKNQLELERVAREKEKALNESKTQFFTNISHEFRTPLSLIAMPLENLLGSDDLPLSVKERLDTMRVNTNKMTRLVNELMDFNKMEDSKLKLKVQRGELVKFITDLALVFNDVAKKRAIHFGVHAMIGSLEGWVDFDKVEKILVNVLSNAFKFTSDNGKINLIINAVETASGKDNCRYLELVVVDNGIGIPKDELPFIFDKFYQATSSAKIANPGTGLGLALTKGLVDLHHGSIKAESTPDSETRFVILIPIDRIAYHHDDLCEEPGYIVSSGNPGSALVNQLENEHLEEVDRDKPHILIVEDNDELRKYISMELSLQFNVLEARDGKEGLLLAIEKSPDLVISDILMPVKTGMELCKEIKTNIKTSHIPFILLSAKTTLEDQIAGISTGADVYITKPFSIRYLLVHINKIIESRRQLYSRFSQDVYLMPSNVANNEIDEAFMQKAIDFIIEKMEDPELDVISIADFFNLSRMQVYRKVKALTGKSVVDLIRMVRLKQALKLLETQKYTVSEIAFQVGFTSSSYFSKCFKDQYGNAPSEYLANRS